MKSVLFLLLLISPAWAVKIPDGAWNGKPWDRKQLLAGVKNGDADALAEWAYCSRRGMLRIPYDAKLIYQRAKSASEKGSIAGERLVAKCLHHGIGVEPDKPRAFKMFSLLAKKGSPNAKVDLALIATGGSAVKKDFEKAERLGKEAMAAGSLRALEMTAALYKKRGYPNFDPRKSLELRVKSFSLSKDVYSAQSIYHEKVYGDQKITEEIITKELWSQAEQVIAQGMQLSHPFAFFTQSYYELDAPTGDKHRGVMLQVRAANLGDPTAMRNLTSWLNKGYFTDYRGERQLLARGNWQDAQKTAKYAYDRGERSNRVTRTYAQQLSRSAGKGSKEKRKLAEKLLIELIARSDCNAHDTLGIQRIQEHQRFNGTQAESDVGFAHLIYHTYHSAYATYVMGFYYASNKKLPSHDLVKGAAVSKYYLDKFIAKKRETEISATKKWLKAVEGFTDEQKEDYRKLVESGFPASEQYRRPAYQLLLKSGDLAPGAKFRE